jgi:hypothetical protein
MGNGLQLPAAGAASDAYMELAKRITSNARDFDMNELGHLYSAVCHRRTTEADEEAARALKHLDGVLRLALV